MSESAIAPVGALRDRPLAAAALAILLVLAGCSGFQGTLDHPLDRDPGSDEIGWENGYWYDESIGVSTGDGLNETEQDALLARTMARVEHIHEREFDINVSVEVISRETYLDRSGGGGSGSGVDRWNEQVWEGLLLVGEHQTVGDAFGETYNSSVQGYYAPANDSIVIVSDSPTPTIDRQTLAHELVHALQDQAGYLGASPPTQDRQLARRSVTEGTANYVEALYGQRCEGEWDCIPRPDQSGAGGGSASDGVFVVLYQPYATGPQFVHQIRQERGWDGVAALYHDPPNSTEQVIHPEAYPDEEPVNVTVPDRSSDEWERFDHDPVADTVGEASIYAMLAVHDEAGVEPSRLYEYQSEPAAGWAGDSLVPYRAGDERYGYVWETKWDTARDAREFERAYREVLSARAPTAPTDGVYVLPEADTYGDAFRVVREGRTVRIVNAPTTADLNDVHERRGA